MTQKILVKKLILFIMAFFLTTPLLGLSKRSADKDRHNTPTAHPANIFMDIAGIPAGQGKQYARAFAAASAVKSLTEIGTNKLFKDPISNSQDASYDARVGIAREYHPNQAQSSLLVSQSIATLVALGMLTGKKNPLSLIRSIPIQRSISLLTNLIAPFFFARTNCNALQYIKGLQYLSRQKGSLELIVGLISFFQTKSLTEQIEQSLAPSDWHRGMRAPASFSQEEYIVLESPWAIFWGSIEPWNARTIQKLGTRSIAWLFSSRYYIKISALDNLDNSTRTKVFNYANWTLAKQIGHLALSPLAVGQQVTKEINTPFIHSYQDLRDEWKKKLAEESEEQYLSEPYFIDSDEPDLQYLLNQTPENPSSLSNFALHYPTYSRKPQVLFTVMSHVGTKVNGLLPALSDVCGEQSSPFTENSNKTEVTEESYETFGVTSEATQSEVEKAYLTWAVKNHPDRHFKTVEVTQAFKDGQEKFEAIKKKRGWN